MNTDDIKRELKEGKCSLGIEFGSTRIKAVLISSDKDPVAVGTYDWENRLEDGVWTYSIEDILDGLSGCYASLKKEVRDNYGVTLEKLSAIGITGAPAFIIGIIMGLIAGFILGEFTGILITIGKLPPFIATLGMMKICRSVTQQCMQTVNPQVPRSFTQIANLSIGGQMFMPIIYWLLIAFIMYWISKHTAFGRHVFAVGSNERASRLSGINTERVKRAVYAIMGLLVGCAAVLQVSRIGAMDYANAGSGYEMDAIAAVIVGGTSMAGGRGSISGTILGVLIIAVMNNLLNLIGVPPFLREAFKGFIVIAAVLLQKKEKA